YLDVGFGVVNAVTTGTPLSVVNSMTSQIKLLAPPTRSRVSSLQDPLPHTCQCYVVWGSPSTAH
ncbi:hypothetical protein FRB91_000709, partial [Serendipita sp. 411]